jgi:hypothetical protein
MRLPNRKEELAQNKLTLFAPGLHKSAIKAYDFS